MHVFRVPAYSPYAVAEFTMGLLLTLNRKIHKAYFRTRDFNFSLNGWWASTSTAEPSASSAPARSDRSSSASVRASACTFWHTTLSRTECRLPLCIAGGAAGKERHHLPALSANGADTPPHQQGHHRQMKDGVYLLNTSRGMLVESESLLDASRAARSPAPDWMSTRRRRSSSSRIAPTRYSGIRCSLCWYPCQTWC